jgi:putative ABC transport system substrate-binding protein
VQPSDLPVDHRAQPKEVAMKRRDFMAAAAGAIFSLPTRAGAQAHKLPRIGVLWHAGSADEEGLYYRGLLQGFRDLGYNDGQNIFFEHLFPNELPELLRSMIAELVALNVDVLVTVGPQTAPTISLINRNGKHQPLGGLGRRRANL